MVELLVVIAIIGILVALMLPSIQASRESARRASCTNKLAQLALAVHDYEAAHEKYPSGTVNPSGPIQNLPNGHHISWVARILPYIDERSLYGIIDPSLSAYHQKNDRARQIVISMLICPSCWSPEWPFSSYAGCHHDTEAPIDTTNQGMFFLNSQLTRDDIKDGAAYTIFLGEKLPDNFDLGWLSGTSSTLRNAGSPLNPSTGATRLTSSAPPWIFSYAAEDTRWQWSGKQVDPISGEWVTSKPGEDSPATEVDADSESAAQSPPDDQSGATSDVSATTSGDVAATPEVTTETTSELKADTNGMLPHSKLGGNTAAPLAVGGFESCHSGGVNFAFGDGSVRFVADTITAGVLGRLAHRADGQVIDSKDF